VVRPFVERTGEAGDAAATVAARAEIMVASSSADGEREAGAARQRQRQLASSSSHFGAGAWQECGEGNGGEGYKKGKQGGSARGAARLVFRVRGTRRGVEALRSAGCHAGWLLPTDHPDLGY
jgi:hypothetical protein